MNNENNSIVSQDHWDIGWENFKLECPSKKDPIIKFIEEHAPPPPHKGRCIEIGAYPCQFSTILGERGYEINGIDMTKKIEDPRLKIWLESNGFKVGTLKKINFLNFETNEKYDVVCSFGFIEHFRNWDNILKRHEALVADKGYLILETPNFAGLFQKIYHYICDKENYKRHIVQSMNPNKWVKCLPHTKYKVLYKGYFGGFNYWRESDKQDFTILQRGVSFVYRRVLRRILKNLPNNRMYSAFCGMVVQKM
jgi:2-polyprenyl-3-methyl-5-hydroxy-6-metoxy-1,4-benzoquinol methylase